MHNTKMERGFTLIELLVAIIVTTALFTVVFYNQRAYNDKSELTNEADKIGLSLTEAQIYGTGAKELSPGSNDFDTPYGLSFNLIGSGNENSYIYFADHDGDQQYDDDWSCPVGGGSECLTKFTLTDGNRIESICILLPTGTPDCLTARQVDISFARPNAASNLTFYKHDNEVLHIPIAIGARITLRSPRGNARTIVVYNTGQISVQ